MTEPSPSVDLAPPVTRRSGRWTRLCLKELRETLRDRLCEMDRRGQKTGAGYYDYDPNTRAKSPNETVEQLVLGDECHRWFVT